MNRIAWKIRILLGLFVFWQIAFWVLVLYVLLYCDWCIVRLRKLPRGAHACAPDARIQSCAYLWTLHWSGWEKMAHPSPIVKRCFFNNNFGVLRWLILRKIEINLWNASLQFIRDEFIMFILQKAYSIEDISAQISLLLKPVSAFRYSACYYHRTRYICDVLLHLCLHFMGVNITTFWREKSRFSIFIPLFI